MTRSVHTVDADGNWTYGTAMRYSQTVPLCGVPHKGTIGATRVCLLSDGCRGKQSFVYERNSFRYADSISAAVTSTASFTLKDRFMRARSRRNEGAPEPR